MATILYLDKEVELAPDEDWSVNELANAEQALGVVYDPSQSAANMMKVILFVSIRRVEPDKPAVLIADEIGQLKFGKLLRGFADLAPLEDEQPTNDASVSPAEQPTSGLPPSEASESQSLSESSASAS